MATLSLNHLEILATSIERYKAQREARLLAEQRMQAAFEPTTDSVTDSRTGTDFLADLQTFGEVHHRLPHSRTEADFTEADFLADLRTVDPSTSRRTGL